MNIQDKRFKEVNTNKALYSQNRGYNVHYSRRVQRDQVRFRYVGRNNFNVFDVNNTISMPNTFKCNGVELNRNEYAMLLMINSIRELPSAKVSHKWNGSWLKWITSHSFTLFTRPINWKFEGFDVTITASSYGINGVTQKQMQKYDFSALGGYKPVSDTTSVVQALYAIDLSKITQVLQLHVQRYGLNRTYYLVYRNKKFRVLRSYIPIHGPLFVDNGSDDTFYCIKAWNDLDDDMGFYDMSCLNGNTLFCMANCRYELCCNKMRVCTLPKLYHHESHFKEVARVRRVMNKIGAYTVICDATYITSIYYNGIFNNNCDYINNTVNTLQYTMTVRGEMAGDYCYNHEYTKEDMLRIQSHYEQSYMSDHYPPIVKLSQVTGKYQGVNYIDIKELFKKTKELGLGINFNNLVKYLTKYTIIVNNRYLYWYAQCSEYTDFGIDSIKARFLWNRIFSRVFWPSKT